MITHRKVISTNRIIGEKSRVVMLSSLLLKMIKEWSLDFLHLPTPRSGK